MQKVRRPSPAMLVALAALFVALGGSVYAAGKIGPKQLRPSAVTTPKIKNQAVTEGKVAPGAISSAKLADGAVTGAKADEASFGPVPSAANAATVGGMTVSSFSFKAAPSTALATIKTIGLLAIQAGCEPDGDPLLTVLPADAGGPSLTMTRTVNGVGTTSTGGAGTLASATDILDGSLTISTGQIEVMSTAGKVTTIDFGARDNTVFTPSENVCVVWGTGVAS